MNKWHDLSDWDGDREPDKEQLEVPHSALLDQARQDFLSRAQTDFQDGKPFHSLRVLQPERAFNLVVDCILRSGIRMTAENDGALFEQNEG